MSAALHHFAGKIPVFMRLAGITLLTARANLSREPQGIPSRAPSCSWGSSPWRVYCGADGASGCEDPQLRAKITACLKSVDKTSTAEHDLYGCEDGSLLFISKK